MEYLESRGQGSSLSGTLSLFQCDIARTSCRRDSGMVVRWKACFDCSCCAVGSTSSRALSKSIEVREMTGSQGVMEYSVNLQIFGQ